MSEKQFEDNLRFFAKRGGCRYTKIPDAIIKRGQKQITEHKRPCDGILSTPTKNIMVELKVGSNSLSGHQWKYLSDICKLNGDALVLRMVPKTKTKLTRYIVEKIISYDTTEAIQHDGGRKSQQVKEFASFEDIEKMIEFLIVGGDKNGF